MPYQKWRMPPRGTDQYYQMVEDFMAAMQTDVTRLIRRQPQSPDSPGIPLTGPLDPTSFGEPFPEEDNSGGSTGPQFYNNSGVTIPGYAVLEVLGVRLVDGVNYPMVFSTPEIGATDQERRLPPAAGVSVGEATLGPLMVNGPDPVPADQLGTAQGTLPYTILYDQSGANTRAKYVGPTQTKWSVADNGLAFTMVGDNSDGTALVVPGWPTALKLKGNATAANATSFTILSPGFTATNLTVFTNADALLKQPAGGAIVMAVYDGSIWCIVSMSATFPP